MSTCRLLSLDPGGTTGWSIWDYTDLTAPVLVARGMIAGGVEGFVDWWREDQPKYLWTELVLESFILDGRTAFPDLTPRDIEGAIVALWDGPKVKQRNTFKRFAPDELLKELGLYWPGAGHDRDSARHAIAYLLTRKHMPTIMWLHPPK